MSFSRATLHIYVSDKSVVSTCCALCSQSSDAFQNPRNAGLTCLDVKVVDGHWEQRVISTTNLQPTTPDKINYHAPWTYMDVRQRTWTYVDEIFGVKFVAFGNYWGLRHHVKANGENYRNVIHRPSSTLYTRLGK